VAGGPPPPHPSPTRGEGGAPVGGDAVGGGVPGGAGGGAGDTADRGGAGEGVRVVGGSPTPSARKMQ
jgi:hypothetical protein